MGAASRIEWTESTWNPITGCTKVSPGCKHCYAEVMAKRLKAMGVARYADGFAVTLQRDVLELPLRWRQPRRIFVNSMSDMFHESVPDAYIRDVFDVMNAAPWHTFQILTKRATRLREMNPGLPWSRNIWMGVSVESQEYVPRIDALRGVGASVRFLSLEPLLGPIRPLDLTSIHWVIAGGESGAHARPVQSEWIREIRDVCNRSATPFFFKQWGGTNKKATGRILDSRTWDEFPAHF